ncbi:MAG: hypothetical protein KIS94_06045 [Chitinophagales bacterium]|nr:hypothetical protein [Chitinophagales bacterium]
MAKKDYYLPETDTGKLSWLANFSSKLSGYGTTLGVPPATLAEVAADLDNYTALLQFLNSLKSYQQNTVAYKNHLRSGTADNAPIGDLPAPPAVPTFTVAPVADIFGRIRKLVQTIKAHRNYTQAIGEDLGIIGAENDFNPNTLKPELKVETAAGGRPNIIWKKGLTEGIKIKVDRGSGTFEFLAVDTQPNYLDTHPLPPYGQSAIWKYTAIYLYNDEEAGQWSDVVSITVAGQP